MARWERGLPLRAGAVQVLAVLVAAQRETPRRALDVVAIGLVLAGPALLVLRHRAPVTTVALSFAPPALYFALGYRFAPCVIALGVAMVSAVFRDRRAGAWVATGAGLAGYLALSRLLGRPPGPVAVLAIAAVLALVLTAAEAVRATRRQRGEQRRARDAEERLRVARDLHDVLGHQVTLVTVHANLALRLLDQEGQAGRVRDALLAIREVSRGTRADLEGVLATLRAGADR